MNKVTGDVQNFMAFLTGGKSTNMSNKKYSLPQL